MVEGGIGQRATGSVTDSNSTRTVLNKRHLCAIASSRRIDGLALGWWHPFGGVPADVT